MHGRKKIGIDLDCEEIQIGMQVKVLFANKYEPKRLLLGTVLAVLSDTLEHKVRLDFLAFFHSCKLHS